MRPFLLSAVLLACSSILAAPATVEEQRLEAALAALPDLKPTIDGWSGRIYYNLRQSGNEAGLIRQAAWNGQQLWQAAVRKQRQEGSYDDRPLYWTRLAITRQLRNGSFAFPLSEAGRQRALAAFERSSRGIDDLALDEPGSKRVLISGFDPFGLDGNLAQMNPSGITALALDGARLQCGQRSARIEAFAVPVRFRDFDQGLIEDTLSPILRSHRADLVATVSMGRWAFDLERFPGGRRSSGSFPDNEGVTQGSESDPLPLNYRGAPLGGPEFVEFSLPAEAMQRVQTPYVVNDNRWVMSNLGWQEAPSLAALAGQIAIAGSGGTYLSNEISYRSVLLRDRLGLKLPVGHIHTPAVYEFDRATQKQIVEQIKTMLCAAVETL
ncbi:hypothetical protein [Chitinimonas lacunae]|uniref:Pyroglutamyl peptidase n=1 Tax=Chitinimonas lacunae TaxID=1963018 RepID=A0ABV8MP97_9NEIS